MRSSMVGNWRFCVAARGAGLAGIGYGQERLQGDRAPLGVSENGRDGTQAGFLGIRCQAIRSGLSAGRGLGWLLDCLTPVSDQ